MNKLDEFLELNELTDSYKKNRELSSSPFTGEDIDDCSLLVCSFCWEDSHEGHDFWSSVNDDYLNWLYDEQEGLETIR